MAEGLRVWVSSKGLGVMQVALVRAAGQPEQKIWKGTIDTIMQITQGAGPLSPCVLIIGNVVLCAQSISTC